MTPGKAQKGKTPDGQEDLGREAARLPAVVAVVRGKQEPILGQPRRACDCILQIGGDRPHCARELGRVRPLGNGDKPKRGRYEETFRGGVEVAMREVIGNEVGERAQDEGLTRIPAEAADCCSRECVDGYDHSWCFSGAHAKR